MLSTETQHGASPTIRDLRTPTLRGWIFVVRCAAIALISRSRAHHTAHLTMRGCYRPTPPNVNCFGEITTLALNRSVSAGKRCSWMQKKRAAFAALNSSCFQQSLCRLELHTCRHFEVATQRICDEWIVAQVEPCKRRIGIKNVDNRKA